MLTAGLANVASTNLPASSEVKFIALILRPRPAAGSFRWLTLRLRMPSVMITVASQPRQHVDWSVSSPLQPNLASIIKECVHMNFVPCCLHFVVTLPALAMLMIARCGVTAETAC
jgi:hypothetical protein